MTYLEEKHGAAGGNEKEKGREQVGQRIGKRLEKGNVAKDVWVLLGGLGEEAAKGRADDGAERPDERHDGKGAGLEFSFGDHFGYHGSDDADYRVLVRPRCHCVHVRRPLSLSL